MHKALRSFVLCCLVLAIVGLPFIAHAGKVKFGVIAPPNNGHTKGMEAMANYVREKTNGRIDIAVFPLGQLGSERSMCAQVQSGTLEMVSATTLMLENFVPESGVLNLPFMFPDLKTAHAVLDDPEVKSQTLLLSCEKGVCRFGIWGGRPTRDPRETADSASRKISRG